MSNKFIPVIILACCLLAVGCSAPGSGVDQRWKAYSLAMDHGDIQTAIVEVNTILSEDTTDQAIIDTLMRLYFIRGNHLGAYKVGSRLTDPDPVDKTLLAESAFNIGLTDVSKKLYMEVQQDSAGLNLGGRYRLATLHYSDEEYDAALEVLNTIVKDDRSLEQMTKISGDNEVIQNVVLYAASFNFAGFIFMELKDYGTAEAYFTEALRVQPDFVLAKNNARLLAQKRLEPDTGN